MQDQLQTNYKDENYLDENLIDYIRQQVGVYDLIITKDTLIENDLGTTGQDANDLIFAFSKKYKVDITNFNFEKYFNDEPGIFGFRDRAIQPFTIGYLQKAIFAGRLDEEVINS